MLISINRRLRDDKGFTLIELMVVVLIIAILIAIAIPTFLGARKRAQRKQAQSALRNTLTHERTFYTDSQTYTETAADLTAIDPGLTYQTAASTSPNTVAVDISADGQIVSLAAWSKSKDCYFIYDNTASGTVYGKTEDGAQASCAADSTDNTPGAVQGPW